MAGDPPAETPPADRGPRALDPIATRAPTPGPTSDLAPGTVIDHRYTITGPGIPGGMGVVYPVTHRELGKPRALKVLHPHLVADAQAVARFREEASLALDLQHPGIVRVFDFGDWAGQKYLVMEWIGGGNLRKGLKDGERQTGDARLPLTEALAILMALTEALAYAHAHQVIHRDLKPENILLDQGRAKVTDFGIAKLLRPDHFSRSAAGLGTTGYMAPEQLQGQPVDARADIYSLGVILYELLCGDLPVGLFALPHEADPTLPASLDALLKRCLARQAAHRFQSVDEFQGALRALEQEIAEAEARQRAAAEAAQRRAREEAEQKHQAEEAARRAAEERTRREAEERRTAEEAARQQQTEAARREAEDTERRRREAEAKATEGQKRQAEAARQAEEERWRQQYYERLQAADRREAERRRAQDVQDQKRTPLRAFALVGTAGLLALAVVIGIAISHRGEQLLPTRDPKAAESPPSAAAPGAATPAPKQGTRTAARAEQIEGGTVRRLGKDDAEMVYIPGGTFTMGDTHGDGAPDERPSHKVSLDGFWLDRTEVTYARFFRFVDATGFKTEGYAGRRDREMVRPLQAVHAVSWNDAVAYCQWAGKRLPTEAEWEYAAKGTDDRKYPWGNVWERSRYAFDDRGQTFTTIVGSHPGDISPFGVLDMAGNASEWVHDWYAAYAEAPAVNPTGPGRGTRRAVRGSGSDAKSVRTTARWAYPPNDEGGGFRCAQAVQ